VTALEVFAEELRSRHFGTAPLLLANVWDAASARAVADAGHRVIATSSAAVAASLGRGDHEEMSADESLAAVARIAAAVDLPVTSDLEAGYGLAPSELVERLLEAGGSAATLRTVTTTARRSWSTPTSKRITSPPCARPVGLQG
jgi:2-methylisocitrate lyase-like PEP mutase family enzyme